MKPIRTALIEDNAPFAQALEEYLRLSGSAVQCVAIYSTGEEAIGAIPKSPPEVESLMDQARWLNFLEPLRALDPEIRAYKAKKQYLYSPWLNGIELGFGAKAEGDCRPDVELPFDVLGNSRVNENQGHRFIPRRRRTLG